MHLIKYFSAIGKIKKILKGKVKIVTHHWSTNQKKGFDVYSGLGNLINQGMISNLEFTYIGRYNKSYTTDGINIINPKTAKELSELLPKFDIYMTGSLEEAGANHVLEAIAAGLPVLYRSDGGSIQEYCLNYGRQYDHSIKSLIKNLQELLLDYENVHSNILKYDMSIDDVVNKYVDIICKI